MQFLGQCPQGFLQLSAAHPLLKAPMTGLIRWILGRQFPPLRPGAQNPKHAMEYRTRIAPRSSPPIGPSFRSKHRFENRPLGVGQIHALDLPRFALSFNPSVS